MSESENKGGDQPARDIELQELKTQHDEALAMIVALQERIDELAGNREQLTVIRQERMETARKMRQRAVEIFESNARSNNKGRHEFEITIAKFKHPLRFRTNESSVTEAVSVFERRFGTRFDPRRMEIAKAKA